MVSLPASHLSPTVEECPKWLIRVSHDTILGAGQRHGSRYQVKHSSQGGGRQGRRGLYVGHGTARTIAQVEPGELARPRGLVGPKRAQR